MGENNPTVPNNPSDEGHEGHDLSSAESLGGFLITTNTPFYPELDSIYNEDGTPSGYNCTFNQAYIFNRTSESEVQDRDERKIAEMAVAYSLPVEHTIKYFVEVIISNQSFLIDSATFTGISGDALGAIGTEDGIQTSFPHIYFDQFDANVGPYTGYFPILELTNGQITQYTQRDNIQLSDRQVRQLGNSAVPDDEGEGGAAHVLQEQYHREEYMPTRLKTIRAGSGVRVEDEYYYIDIHATTGWSGANCCDYDEGECGGIGGAAPADADWWSYVEGSLMPSRFRGLKAGDQINFTNSADDDACITEISCNPTTPSDPTYDSVTTKKLINFYNSDTLIDYPSADVIKIIVDDSQVVEITPFTYTLHTPTAPCSSTTFHGTTEYKLCNSDLSSTAPVSNWYNTSNVVVASIDANPLNNSYINSGPLGIGTTTPAAGKAITIEGTARIQGSTLTDGTLELGNQSANASTLSYTEADQTLTMGVGINVALGTISAGTWQGTAIADTYISSAVTWNAKQDALTFGIADTNAVQIDSASVADDEFARFTANGLESRSASDVRSDLSLGSLATLSAIDADSVTVSNLEVDNFKASAIVTEAEGIGSSDNDTSLPTSAAVKDYVDNTIIPDTNTYVTAAAFNTSDGILTLTRNDAATVTADLDGKYQDEITASSRLSATLIGADGDVSNTEYGYLNGVTSAIQTQLGAKQATLTFGIADTNAVQIDSASVADNEFARFTANGLESRSASDVRSDLSLGSLATLSAIDADSVTVSNLEVDNFKASAIVTEAEGIGSSDNDTSLPTSAAVKDYVDNTIIPDTNTYVTAAAFNTSDGILTLTRNDAATVTADLDGKYQDEITASSRLSATLIGADGDVSNTEYGYLNGVTSAIQTQLDAKQATLTFGIGTSNVLRSNGTMADNEFLKVDGTQIEGRSSAELKSDLSLNNVENTALSTWAGTSNITTVGTISAGTWQGTAIADGYISSASTWNAKQDALTFGIADTNAVQIDSASVADDEFARFTANGLESRSASDVRSDLSLGSLATLSAIDADSVTVSNLEVDNFKASAIVTEAEGIGSNDNDTSLPTSAAVKDYVDNTIIPDTNTYVTAAAFNTSDGILTLTRNDAATVTADLDGKYQDEITASSRLSATLIGADGDVSNTEYGYLNGVTSAIQTQLDAKQATLTFGIGTSNVLRSNGTMADNEFLKVDGTQIEGRSSAELKSDLSLNNVENTALSTWAGTSNITTVGTISAGTWQGTAIADGYISSASTWNAKQAALTFGIADTNAVQIDSASVADNEFARFTADGLESRSASEVRSDLSLSSTDSPTFANVKIGTDGTLELGDPTATLQYTDATNNLTIGEGIKELDCDSHDTFTLFSKCSTALSSEYAYMQGGSPATGSAILGGSGNSISGHYNVIVGGANQLISGSTMNFIGGGSGINIEESEFAVSIGGRNNDISGSNFGVIGGGYNNLISGGHSNVIGGGKENIITGLVLQNTIAGGTQNKIAAATSSMIAGGETNQIADSTYGFIGAGATHVISAGSDGSAIVGGAGNTISNSTYSFIAGGQSSQITNADYAFTAGNYSRVEAGHDGAFVFSDSLTVPVLSTGADTMVLKFKSGVFIDGDSGLYINSANGIHINGNPVLTGATDANTYVTAASFNTSDGVLTLTRNDAATVTADLDGKYQDEITSSSRLSATLIGSNGNVSNTEYGYLNGVTSAIQTQLDAKQATLTFGIADTNAVKIDSASVADNDYTKFTANGLEGRSFSEVKTDLSLNNVENTALSTWGGSSNITTVGTISAGTWQGTAIASGYIADAATWNDKQDEITSSSRLSATLIGSNGNVSNTEYGYLNGVTSAIQTQLDAKQATLTFGIADTNAVKIDSASVADNEFARFTANGLESRSASEVRSDLSLGSLALLSAVDADSVTLSNVEVDNFKASAIITEAEGIGSNDNDTSLPTSAAVKDYVDNTIIPDTNTYVTAASFNTSDGILTLTRNDAATVTADLDGKYQDEITSSSRLSATLIGANGDVSNTEYGYLDGVTSAIQTQLDAKQATLTFGIADTNAVKIDSASVADNDYTKFTANGLEGRSFSEVKTDLSLNNVENTALSTWAGSSNVTTVGTISAGTWQGTAIADGYISSASTWNAKQAALTFGIADTNAVKIDSASVADNEFARFTANGLESRSASEVRSDLSLGSLATLSAIDADSVTVGNLEVDNFKASAIVTEAEGIGSNDNDTSLPTSAAVKDYVDNTIIPDTNTYVTAASFNTSDGILTLTRNDAATVTADLDGKYQDEITSSSRLSATLIGANGDVSNTEYGYLDGVTSAIQTQLDAKQATLTFGIADTNAVKIDSASVADNDYTKFTANGLEGRSFSEVKTDLSLNNVENTALSTWAGSSNVTTVGTISAGTWQGTAIADGYISSASTWNAKQAALTFGIADTNAVKIDSASVADNEYARFTANGLESRSTSEVAGDLGLSSTDSPTFANVTIGQKLIHDGDTNTYLNFTTDTISLYTAGIQRVTVNSDGNVGIGSAPTNKLDVFGHFTATTKSFLIDHPTKEDKKLQYASLEGPEHAVYVRGTHDGSLIELPEYWSELVHKDSLTVSLTPLGEHQNLYVKYKDATCISVGGVKGSYDYIVYGERKDTDKLEVEPLKV